MLIQSVRGSIPPIWARFGERSFIQQFNLFRVRFAPIRLRFSEGVLNKGLFNLFGVVWVRLSEGVLNRLIQHISTVL